MNRKPPTSGASKLRAAAPAALVGGLIAMSLAFAVAGSAQDAVPDPPSAGGEDSVALLEQELSQVREEIEAANTLPVRSADVEILRRLEHAIGAHLDALGRSEDLALQQSQTEEALQASPTSVHGEPPYSIEAYDRAHAASLQEQGDHAQLERAAATARASRDRARSDLAAREQERRQAKEEGSPDLARIALESRLARTTLGLREAELQNALTSAKIKQSRATRAADVEAFVSERITVRDSDVRKAVGAFDEKEALLRRRLERAELDLQEARARWQGAQAQSERGEARPNDMARLRAVFALRQRTVALLGEQLDRLAVDRELVQRRLDLLGNASHDRSWLREWLAEIRLGLEELDRARSLDVAEITTLENELLDLDRRIGETALEEPLRRQRKAYGSRLELLRENLADLDGSVRLRERVAEELHARVGDGTLRDGLAASAERSRAVWRFEIFSSGDQSITVGKLVTALALIVFGILVARFLSRLFEKRLLPSFGFDAGASHAFASLGFYALLVAIFLASLQTVNIPLTAFAVLGGALAIGVGFGSQNVVSNFISGIILLAERPIKIGDLIQVEETYGNVEEIGLRSTRIRTGENIHYILPNASLLESRLVNWTLNDAKVRVKLDVGVAYGSPTQQVKELILVALKDQAMVLSTPRPIILFTDFGDNSLDFRAHFWVSVRTQMDRLSIESEIRFRLDELFREAGISIAFPQRDVHLDSTNPVEVRMVGPSTPESEEPS